MTPEHIVAMVVVGLVAGFVAAKVVRGSGFGFLGDIVVGILGAFIGDWVLPRLGVHLSTGLFGQILNATIGAILLLGVVRLIRRRR
jgi:uncharacterized membrane protein YeaQ/YmgE (transglycosylase-associated protein family)